MKDELKATDEDLRAVGDIKRLKKEIGGLGYGNNNRGYISG